MRSILVSHPHAAVFANGAACGLADRGELALYVTGVAVAEGTPPAAALDRLARVRPQLRNRILAGIPRESLRSLAPVELGARLVARAARELGAGPNTYDALFWAHDAFVARMPWPAAGAVYAYEDGARATFERARRQGIARVWDLPAAHHATAERIWREESARWPGAMGARPPSEPPWKKRRKEAELGLASVISVASRFTQGSLHAWGAEVPILVTPYGFPLDSFRPRPGPPTGRFTVLAVGSQDLRKGTPYLLEAWKRAGLRDAVLRLIGPMRLTAGFLSRYQGLFEHVPHLPRARLEREYHAADLLAFPTLGDGFGVVLQEAMCCGTPVLTTPCGGGPEVIADGVDGWIAPDRDVDALVDRLRAAAQDRDGLHRMGLAARRRAESWSWKDAGAALGAALALALDKV